MKKLLLCVAMALTFLIVDRQEVNAAQLTEETKISDIFLDPAFAQTIAGRLNKSVDDTVTQVELDGVQYLYLDGENVGSIEGIQYLNYAYEIGLSNNNINDLTPFNSWEPSMQTGGGFTIDTLDLSNNPITDLTPLANLSGKVRYIYLLDTPVDNSQVDNLIAIRKNLNPLSFYIAGNHIDDFSRLGGTFTIDLKPDPFGVAMYQTVDLGEFIVLDDAPLTIPNASRGFAGETLPIVDSSLTHGGIKAEDNQSVTWSNLFETKPEELSFTAEYDNAADKFLPSVTYSFSLKYAKGGSVTVNYVDDQGSPLEEPTVVKGVLGTNYVTEAKEFVGYTLKEIPANATGVFEEAPQEVIYVYTKNPAAEGSVIVKYVDEEGTEISDQTKLSGPIGEEYVTKEKKIASYEITKTPENATGLYGETEIEVIYVYRKISDQNGGDQDPKKDDEAKSDDPKKGDEAKDDNTPKTSDSSQTEKEESDQSPEIQNISTKNASSTAGKSDVKADAEDRQTAKSSAKTYPQTGAKSPLLLSLLGGGILLACGWLFFRLKK